MEIETHKVFISQSLISADQPQKNLKAMFWRNRTSEMRIELLIILIITIGLVVTWIGFNMPLDGKAGKVIHFPLITHTPLTLQTALAQGDCLRLREKLDQLGDPGQQSSSQPQQDKFKRGLYYGDGWLGWTPQTCAHAIYFPFSLAGQDPDIVSFVDSNIRQAYHRYDGPNGPLGYVVTDTQTLESKTWGPGAYNKFENGYIIYAAGGDGRGLCTRTPDFEGTGASYSTPIFIPFPPFFPYIRFDGRGLGDALSSNPFEYGDLPMDATYGRCAHWLYGPVFDKWRSMGQQVGALGYPIDDLTVVGTEAVGSQKLGIAKFQHGIIYWEVPSGRTAEVHGLIFEKFKRIWEEDHNYIGPALQDERRTNSAKWGAGAMSIFKDGYIYYHPQSGTYWVHGDILNTYIRFGLEQSCLGYPKSSEFDSPAGGRMQNFDGGTISWENERGTYIARCDIT